MRAFTSIFKLRFKMGMTYRVAAVAAMATQFFWGFMLIMIYSAFYQSSLTVQTVPLNRLITYVWLQQAFLYAIVPWVYDRDLFEMIMSGDIAYELTRPRSLYPLWFAKNISTRLSGVILRFPLLLLCASLMPEAYHFMLPVSPSAFFLSIVALVCGCLMMVSYTLISCIIAFFTISGEGIRVIFVMSAEFLAGHLVPIILFPEKIQAILYMLPFAYVNDFAFRIYTGDFSIEYGLRGLVVEFIWLFILIALGYLITKAALKRTVVQGG